ncbi:MAG: FAD-dependent thymidylate synthase [Planctomycetota bacterium]|nr:FAD-dependent thymidylate synthase [Planctomycetota bacterium]
MLEVEQSAELIQCTPDAGWLIERIARVCYHSEDRMKCDCPDGRCPRCAARRDAFLASLIKRRHESVFEHAAATFRLMTDRGVTHELVRHRLASYTQSSTRYIRYAEGVPAVRPLFTSPEREGAWREAMRQAEKAYSALLDAGAPPQEARDVLPACTAAIIFVTANFREWRHIIRLRLAKDAHPKFRVLAHLILTSLAPCCPVFFSDIEKELA